MKKGVDYVFSFDTTGSVYTVLALIKNNIKQMTKEIFSNADGDVRVGVIAHGDYCDKDTTYTIRILDLTDDEQEILDFVTETGKTYGGDSDECYELVLNQARTTISWGADREKVLIMIGDANPHSPSYPLNNYNIDWRNEVGLLAEAGVKIFAVHALAQIRMDAFRFYNHIADKTGGKYLTLDNFTDIVPLLMSACYSQYSEERLNEYVSVIRKSGKMTKALARNIETMTGKVLEESKKRVYVGLKGLVPVAAGRFQMMPIEGDVSIKDFVESKGITFKKGRAFYELTKSETVQQYKEIILQDKETGDMFCGTQVREVLGLLPQCEKGDGSANETLKPAKGNEYRVFVQSTSYNRKLPDGSSILYEVEDWDAE